MARALYPDELGPDEKQHSPPKGAGLDGAVDVLVDNSGHIGPLSYLVPEGVAVRRGDAVKVPFGKRTNYGIVLGGATTDKANRELLEVYGKRVTAAELDLAVRIARHYFCPLGQIAQRLAPRDGKAAVAVDGGNVVLRSDVVVKLPEYHARRLATCAPLADQTLLAAGEAARMARTGQVLVLCPTRDSVKRVLQHFESGAVWLDAKNNKGSWKGFAQGSVQVAVATRTAALYSAANLAGIIVVDSEHPGHREKAMPYTHARDVAAMRAQASGCALLLTSPTPSASSSGARVKAVGFGGRRDWPAVVVAHENDPANPALPGEVLYLDEPYFIVDENPVWLCARCMQRRRQAETCSRCSATEVFQTNWDEQRAKLAIPKCQPVTVANAGALAAGSVVVVPVDGLLNLPGLQPEMRAAVVFDTLAKRVGAAGKLVVLTRQPNHPLVKAWGGRTSLRIGARLWEVAKEGNLPPFSAWIRVMTTGKTAPDVTSWPGKVFGPRRLKNEWEIVVSLPRGKTEELNAAFEALRKRRKVRVEVL